MAYNEFDISAKGVEQLPMQGQMSTEVLFTLCALVQANIQDENDAIRKYFQLLAILTDEDDIAEVKEIISDELNHALKLKQMVEKYSKIKPATT